MKKKIAAIATAMLVMIFLAFTAAAGNLSAPATIKIDSDPEKLTELSAANTVLDVYKIAELSGADYVFAADGPFHDLSVTEEERTSEEDGAVQAKAAEIAQQALAIIKENAGITPVLSAAALGEDLSGLETGDVYLVVAHGSDLERADYFDETFKLDKNGKKITAEDGSAKTDLVTIAQTAQKTYTFLPMLLTVLDNETTVSIDPKYAIADRYGAVRITKTLSAYDTIGKATFVFKVTGTDEDGNTVFSDAAGLTFSGAGRQSVVVAHIPVGTLVTVEEVYSGSRYTNVSVSEPVRIESAVPADIEITDNTDLPNVSIINDHSDDEKHGHGITNHFEFEDGGWVWYKDGVKQN